MTLQNIFGAAAPILHGNMMALTQHPETLPEALALYTAPYIRDVTLIPATKNIFGLPPFRFDLYQVLAECNAAIGRYTFAFPQWRFLTQNFNGASLVEHAGMQRQTRPNDVRDDTLPKSDPQRDHFGAGFTTRYKGHTIEYRRAYILCSDGDTMIVIRNSSHYFGRDRLPHPAFVSFEKLSPEQLRDITDADFAAGGVFTPWHESVKGNNDQELAKAVHIQSLLRTLHDFDGHLHHWLFNEGATHTADFIDVSVQRQTAAGKTDAPFYLCLIDAHQPPWQPIANTEATPALAQSIRDGHTRMLANGNRKPVFLSSRFGDWPTAPK